MVANHFVEIVAQVDSLLIFVLDVFSIFRNRNQLWMNICMLMAYVAYE